MIQAPVKPFGANFISHFCKLENVDSNDVAFWQNNENTAETGWIWQKKV